MRKLKLLFAACALMGVSQTWADVDWTDKTATYVVNPGFESCTVTTTNAAATSSAAPKDISGNWTQSSSAAWSSSAVVAYGGTGQVNGASAPSADNASNSGNALGVSVGWGGTVTYRSSSAVTLPAGRYRMTVHAYNNLSGKTQFKSLNGFVPTSGSSYLSTMTAFTYATWVTDVITFDLPQATEGKFQIGGQAVSGGSGDNAKVFFDNITLEYIAWTEYSSTETYDMTSWIVNPSFELNTFNGTQADGSTSAGGGQRKKPTGYTCYFNVSGWEDCAENTTNPANGTYCMNAWFGSVTEMKFYQTIDYLPEGVYEISAKARTNESTTGIYTYGIVNGGSPVVSASWDESKIVGEWNSYESWQTLTARVSIVTGGSLQFGLRSDKFVQFDDFHLTYLGSDLLLASAISAWNTAHDALAALDATALPDAAEAAITTELAKSRPETLVPLEAATAALQALIDSYDGIKAAFDEYKDLKAQVADLKNTSKYDFTGDDAVSTLTSTLSDIDDDAEAATDAATLTALLPSLRTAGNTFVTSIESNDGFDLTYNIVNNSFETGALSPWTTNGSNDTGVRENSNGTYTTTGVDGSYLFNTWNNGNGSKVSQTLSSLPEGYYTVTALVASDAGNTINILAGAVTKTIDADAGGKGQFVEGTTDKTLVSDGSLEIGTNSTTWYKSDYFRLTYYTVTAGAAEAWAAAKAAAEAARDDAAYTNVTGSERTNLLAEIAKAEPSTAEDYGTATTALQEATSAFTAAKDSYDALITMRTVGATYTTVAWPRASAVKKTALDDAIAAAPTSAADAVTKTNAIETAYRQFVESNGLAEGVAAVDYTSTYLAGADPDTNTGWTNGIGTDWRSQEIYTKGDGNQGGRYYDGGWSASAAVNINMTRELTLPEGQYQLQITARGSSSLTSYTMSIGGETVNLPKDGAGATTGTFGHGWSDQFVVFNSDGSTPLTLAIAASSTEYQQWISFNRLRLVRLGVESVTISDAGFATYVPSHALDFSDATIKAYKVKVSTKGIATLTKVDKVPADTPVLLYKENGATEAIPVTASADAVSDNDLVAGTGEAVPTTDGAGNTNMILNVVDEQIGFYFANDKAVATDRAYLHIASSLAPDAEGSGSRMVMVFADETTGVNDVRSKMSEVRGTYYNLNGQRVEKPAKGLYIVNGKKVIIK